MNTVFFHRGPKKLNPIMQMLELSRRPFGASRRNINPPESACSIVAPNVAPRPTVRLSPGGYRPKEENTTFMDRATALRALIASHLGLSAQAVRDDLRLQQPCFARQTLLCLAGAIDLQLGVYLNPESFAPGMTVGKLVELVLGPAKAA
jgi:hypothetical protein